MRNTLALPSGHATDWDGTLLAFLAEKERRTGSRRTSVGSSRMFFHFFGQAQCPQQPAGVRLSYPPQKLDEPVGQLSQEGRTCRREATQAGRGESDRPEVLESMGASCTRVTAGVYLG